MLIGSKYESNFSQERLNHADNQTLLKSMYIRAVILCISWLFYVNL